MKIWEDDLCAIVIYSLMLALSQRIETYYIKFLFLLSFCFIFNCQQHFLKFLLQKELLQTQEELTNVKVRLNESKKKTVDMFLDIFNDFSHAATADKLRSKADLYKSTPSINILQPACPREGPLVSSASMHSELSSAQGSGVTHHSVTVTSPPGALTRPPGGMTGHSHSASTLDVSVTPSSPTSPLSRMSRSMFDLSTSGNHASSTADTNHQGSPLFQEKVGGLRDRLAVLLDTNYNRLITPVDTTSSYIKNIRMRRLRPRGNGRVFTVFSRAARKYTGSSSTDGLMQMQLGRRD